MQERTQGLLWEGLPSGPLSIASSFARGPAGAGAFNRIVGHPLGVSGVGFREFRV